jgi:hypothetical protein
MAMSEEKKVKIMVDGQQANASFNQIATAVRLLSNDLKKMNSDDPKYKEKAEELKKMKDRMNELRPAVTGTDNALQKMNEEFLQMTPFGPMINAITMAMGKGKTAVTVLSTAFKGLGRAILTTGFGALIIALGLVINYFTTTQDGIDRVNKVLQPLNSILQRVIGVLQELGGYLIDGFTKAINSPYDALKSFVGFIQGQLINRITSIGTALKGVYQILTFDFEAGFKSLGDAVIQATLGIEDGVEKAADAAKRTGQFFKDAANEGTRIANLQISIEKAEIELAKNRQKYAEEYKKAAEIAENVAASAEERAAAAQRGIEVTNQRLKEEQALLDMKIEKLSIEQKQNDTSREGEMEMAELIAQRNELETQASEARTTARSKFNVATQAMAAEDKKRHEETMKQLKEQEKAEQEKEKKRLELRQKFLEAEAALERSLEDLRVSLMEDGLAKTEAQLALNLERELAALEKRKLEILNNETITQEERLAIEQQYTELAELTRQENLEALKEARAEEREKDLEELIEKKDEDLEAEMAFIEDSFRNAIDAEFRKKEALLEIQKQYALEKMALLDLTNKDEFARYQQLQKTVAQIDKQIADNKIDEEKRAEEFKKQIRDEGLAYLSSSLKAGLDLFEENSKARRAMSTATKAIEIAEVIRNGIKESTNWWERAATLGPILGPIVGATLVAATAIRTAGAVNKIRTTQYATGGSTGSGRVIDMVMDRSGAWRMPNGQGAKNVGTFARGGHVNSASLGVIGEAGSEWVGPNWMIRSPKYANIFGYLEAERRRATPFATGGMTASAPPQIPQNSSATADLQQFMAMIEQFGEMQLVLEQIRDLLGEWPSTLRVVNDPRDILDGVRVLNEIEADSRINR